MRKVRLSFLILIGAAVLIGTGGYLWAQPPEISIELNFDKTFYEYGEPVGVEVLVSNDSGRELLISKGFSSKLYYLEIWIMDPAGRLLVGQRDEPHMESPDAPPLPFVSYQGKFVQVAHCEVLPIGWSAPPSQTQTDDLRAYYPLELPGYYTAQVKVSAKIFKGQSGDPCDVNDYEWAGLLKSNMVSFYMEGSTEVDVIPKWWRLAWKDGRYLIPDIAVTVWPQEGKTVDDYNKDSIKLNNVAAKEVVKMYSFLRREHYLLALFKKQEAINSLGPVRGGSLVSGSDLWQAEGWRALWWGSGGQNHQMKLPTQ